MRWISVKERLPEPEEKVLILIEDKYKRTLAHRLVFGFYEDGNVGVRESSYQWEDYDLEDDEEKDDEIIPEGWVEYSLYSYLDAPICDTVTHWMPLSELPMPSEEN